MAFFTPSRTILPAMLAACALLLPATALHAQPFGRQPHSGFGQRPGPGGPHNSPLPHQEHLSQWMDRHRNMPLAQQQNALSNEPGFRDLPQQTQQRMRDRLTQLNNMPEQQRQRLLARTELIERLSPAQRQQFRSSVQQLGEFPPDRRRLVARAFRDIREMPPAQREAVLNSEGFRGQFTDQERGTLANLLSVEPYLPSQHPGEPPDFGR